MNKLVFIFFIFISHFVVATTTFTVGASGDNYTTIAAAYAACTGATDYILELQSDYDYNSETTTGTVTISLGTLANKSSTNTVTIWPASGATLTFTGTVSAIFTLNGADWVIFDGRAVGAGGSALTVISTSVASGARVFKFQSDATNNTIKYISIQGSGTTTGGPIGFGSGTTTGNTNNTITNNNITKSSGGTPAYGIYSYGTDATINNSSNTVSNNNFFDLGGGDWCGIVAYSDGWTVSGNHFYQTAAITLATTDLNMIYVGANCVSVTITGNFFGGRATSCGGAAFAITTGSYILYGINFNSVTGTVSILNNTFANITATSTGTGSVRCIDTYNTATYTIGSAGNGNTFGSTTTTGSITINGSTASTDFYGIYHSGTNASNVISYNTFAGITQAHTTAATFPEFYGIYAGGSSAGSITYNTFGASAGAIQLTGTGVGVNYEVISWNSNNNATITNNTFQNFTVSNAGNTNDNSIIYVNGTGTNTISSNTLGSTSANNMSFSLTDQVYVIHCYSGGTPTISGNTIQQFNQSGTGSSAGIYGIYIDFMSGVATISSNNIKNITTAGTGSYAFSGIYLYSTSASATNSITSNEISAITASSATEATVVGIEAYDGGGTIQKNRIRSMTLNSSNASAYLFGISVDAADNLNFYNNVVILDNGAASPVIRGILSRSGTSNTFNFYHNTVKIYGTATSGANNSNAFADLNTSGSTINVKNNVFQNKRTNSGGTGVHLAIRYTDNTATHNSDFNYLEASGTGGKVGHWNGTDYTSFASFKTASSTDASSTNGTITINALGSVSVGSAGTVANLGTDMDATVATDLDGVARHATTPWMGAFETAVALPIELISFIGKKSGRNNVLNWSTVTEINNDFFTIEKAINGIDFKVIGYVDGAGNSNQKLDYTMIDSDIDNIINYYRLKQTDYDGIFHFSEVISVDNRLDDETKEVAFTTNLMGQEVNEFYRGVIIIIYKDGTSIKVIQ